MLTVVLFFLNLRVADGLESQFVRSRGGGTSLRGLERDHRVPRASTYSGVICESTILSREYLPGTPSKECYLILTRFGCEDCSRLIRSHLLEPVTGSPYVSSG